MGKNALVNDLSRKYNAVHEKGSQMPRQREEINPHSLALPLFEDISHCITLRQSSHFRH